MWLNKREVAYNVMGGRSVCYSKGPFNSLHQGTMYNTAQKPCSSPLHLLHDCRSAFHTQSLCDMEGPTQFSRRQTGKKFIHSINI